MKKTELQKGIKIESEHKDTIDFLKRFHKKYGRFPINKEVFKNIAKDHLKEDKKYYTKLMKAKL